MSAERIPQIAVVMGSCTAGGAYVPAMSDETIIVKGTGTIFLGGPPLVKAATGRGSVGRGTGRRRRPHAPVRRRGLSRRRRRPRPASGAHDRQHAQRRQADAGRSSRRPRSRATTRARSTASSTPIRGSPTRSARSSRGFVDGSRFDEFKERYGATLVTGFARLHGLLVGIIANNGVLFSESALKATHFIELCNLRGIPLVFLQNITGFIVGRQYRARRDREGRRQDGPRRRQFGRAEVHGGHRRIVRRRQLRHVRAGLRAAIAVDVAQRAHLGDGRRAGRRRARRR